MQLLSRSHSARALPSARCRSYAETTTKLVDKYLVPRFEKFQKATAKLADDLDATCNGKPERLSAAREDFDQVVLAWAEIEFLRFGPMAVTGRPERISFWPDPRGFMQRQLRALIAKRDATALEPAALAAKSAAIQGLPALESLLTAKPPITAEDEDGRYRCRLAVAIAKNLQGIAARSRRRMGRRQRLARPHAGARSRQRKLQDGGRSRRPSSPARS